MAKIQIKSDKLTPFGGIFSIMEQFDALLSQTIDSTLGLRCKFYGYQYSEIFRSLMCVYFCGGTCIEDVSTHLMKHLSLHPRLRTCSADTILRAIEELTCKNTTYISDSGKSYDFNIADNMNKLLINALLKTGQLEAGKEYDIDFDHQHIEAEKFDAKPTYKKFLGYGPGVAVIGDNIVGIENRDGNTNVRFYQKATLERIFNRLEYAGVHIYIVLAWIVAHARKRLSAWLSHTASYSTFVQTDAHPYMTQCLPCRDGRKKKSMALSSN